MFTYEHIFKNSMPLKLLFINISFQCRKFPLHNWELFCHVLLQHQTVRGLLQKTVVMDITNLRSK